jgi:carbonic anhydrase/acetyltransferase-like protein (isoleucine patch superfamily)
MLHGCEIGDGSLIGIGSTILNGVKIGKNCLVGAHTLIPEGKTIPDNSMVLGTPGKVVKTLTEEQIQGLKRAAAGYVANAARFVRDCRLVQVRRRSRPPLHERCPCAVFLLHWSPA